MNPNTSAGPVTIYESIRPELASYLARMVVRGDIAEELTQQTALKMLQSPGLPTEPDGLRAWLFRVGTKLALDYLRRHSTWREHMLDSTRERMGCGQRSNAEGHAAPGSPEMKNVAREHLAVCFACTLRNLPATSASALLLKEVYGFTVAETARVLDARPTQVKNWIQDARSTLRSQYAKTCALVVQEGVCFQCVELDGFFEADGGDPLAGTDRGLDARLEILRQTREDALGPWQQVLMRLVEEVLDCQL